MWLIYFFESPYYLTILKLKVNSTLYYITLHSTINNLERLYHKTIITPVISQEYFEQLEYNKYHMISWGLRADCTLQKPDWQILNIIQSQKVWTLTAALPVSDSVCNLGSHLSLLLLMGKKDIGGIRQKKVPYRA